MSSVHRVTVTCVLEIRNAVTFRVRRKEICCDADMLMAHFSVRVELEGAVNSIFTVT